MEKLIELLNEWERERVNHNTKEYIKREKNSFTRLGIIEVISKSYGFIEWLVENDKIDFEKYRIMDTRKYLHQHIIGNACYVDIRADVPNYEFILALLSIQDEPIEFLISILK